MNTDGSIVLKLVSAAVGAVMVFAASAVPDSAAAAPAAPRAQTVKTQNLRVDMDGDGKKDAVSVVTTVDDESRAATVVVTVTTAKRRTAHYTFGHSYWTDESPGLYAAAKLDKAKGYELIVNLEQGDSWNTAVVSWRKDRLVTEIQPYRGSSGRTDVWSQDAEYIQGFKFFTSKGKRYVDAAMLGSDQETGNGRIYRSVWRSNAWHFVGSRKYKASWTKAAKAWTGFRGVKLIKP